MSKFTPSPQEVALVNQIFQQADTQKLGVVTGEAAVKVFSGSKLSPAVLAEIWNLADDENKGVLTRKDVAVAIRLLGHAQRGERVDESFILKPGAVPSLEGLNAPVSGHSSLPTVRSPPPGVAAGLPPLTAQDKAKFIKLFLGYGPTNGLLPGEKARDVFVKSKLPVDKLSQIWNLADTKKRGALDVTDFTIAMYLIQGSMSGALPTIPQILPPFVYDQAKPGSDGIVTHTTGSSTLGSPTSLSGFNRRPVSTVQPQYTGQGILQPQTTGQRALQPQTTGQRPTPPLPVRTSNISSMPAFPPAPTSQSTQWDVTASEKSSADGFFDSLDNLKKGFIEADVAVPFMLQSKLSDDVLAQIWDLADLNNDGRLTRDGFAVAFHLIQAKLAGKEVPATLPATLIPPSMRGGSASQAPTQSQVPDSIKDLLWDDTPPPSAAPTQTFVPTIAPQRTGTISPQHTAQQPASNFFGAQDPFQSSSSAFTTTPAASQPSHRDLLGDDDEPVQSSPPLQDKSAEIGNAQNHLHSTNRALETTKNEREDLERRIADQAAQLAALESQLSTAKASYETETRLLATLRERFSTQTMDIQKTRQELIRAESDLSAVRVEKAEVEGSVLRDKEEVRELQRRMTEVGMEVEASKAAVEKAKKEAKQQKGLLAIARKQLATREAEKAKVAKELEESEAEAAAATKEREDAEAELAKIPAVPITPPERVSSPSVDSLTFAAAQPLPGSPDLSSPVSGVGSPGSTKSNNPFERIALGGGTPRSQSPFLPFAGSILPTPPTSTSIPVASVPPASEDLQTSDPFGFEEAFGADDHGDAPHIGDGPPSATTATSTDEDSPFESAAQHPPADALSPTETELFHTPPSTATIPNTMAGADQPSTEVPKSGPTEPEPEVPGHFPEISEIERSNEDHTDLSAQLQELEVNESDTDSDDDEPLTNVKAKLRDSVVANGDTAPPSGFDSVFGTSSSAAAEASSGQQPEFTESTPKAPFIPVTNPEAPNQNGSVGSAGSSGLAGVSDFDEALGLSSGTSASQFSHVSQFTFDSAFDDDFDFAAAKAATGSQETAAAPSPAFGSAFPPVPTATVPSSSPAVSAFPPAPAAGSTPSRSPTDIPTFPPTISGPAFPPASSSTAKPESNGFDAIFLPPASSSTATEPFAGPALHAAPSKPFAFEDAFASSPSNVPAPAIQTAASNGSHGISFDDAFGGNASDTALDESFSSSTHQHAPPSSPPPSNRASAFPTSSIPSSPNRENSSSSASRRSLSPPPRQTSPPPRGNAAKSRPSTASSEKEKPTRSSKLSIRLPFGRKKAKHEPMPSHLSQSLLVEEPGANATPAAEDDIEAVKTLCSMGFSRTQAVTALEQYDYDVQRALNSLLGTR